MHRYLRPSNRLGVGMGCKAPSRDPTHSRLRCSFALSVLNTVRHRCVYIVCVRVYVFSSAAAAAATAAAAPAVVAAKPGKLSSRPPPKSALPQYQNYNSAEVVGDHYYMDDDVDCYGGPYYQAPYDYQPTAISCPVSVSTMVD